MDPKNIRTIEYWPTPTSVADIRSFLGLVGYYRKFIENFQRIACPMTTFQNKENNLLWTTKCEEIFQKLKHLLMIAPILQIADPYGYFIVCTDASKEGMRGFLL